MSDSAPAGWPWWAIDGESLMGMLREVAAGGDPDLVYAEHYVNSEVERLDEQ